jgi:hypothetical protein
VQRRPYHEACSENQPSERLGGCILGANGLVGGSRSGSSTPDRWAFSDRLGQTSTVRADRRQIERFALFRDIDWRATDIFEAVSAWRVSIRRRRSRPIRRSSTCCAIVGGITEVLRFLELPAFKASLRYEDMPGGPVVFSPMPRSCEAAEAFAPSAGEVLHTTCDRADRYGFGPEGVKSGHGESRARCYAGFRCRWAGDQR